MSILFTRFLMQNCSEDQICPCTKKPCFTPLLLLFLMQDCKWGPESWFVPRSPSSHGFYYCFLCKTASEDLICPYTKEGMLYMVFIAVSYARLQVRTWASLPPESSQVVAKGDGLRVKNVVWVVYLESKRYSRYLKNKYIIRKDPKNLFKFTLSHYELYRLSNI